MSLFERDFSAVHLETRIPMKTSTVLISMGTRPEAIKLAPLVHALQQRPWARVCVLATAQHREMLDRVLDFFEIEADVDLDLMQPDQGLADLTSRMIPAVDQVLQKEAPDFVLSQGDTTTVLVTGLCSFYRGIPMGHVEAGLRTGNPRFPFPEEMNRTLVGRLAALHFAPTTLAAENLLREGVRESSIFVTGNTGIDALHWASGRVEAEAFLPPAGQRQVLVTLHRRENQGVALEEICRGLLMLAQRPDINLVLPVHPNPRVGDPIRSLLGGHARITLIKPLDYPDFVAAMNAADLILTDSGGIQEEAPALGKPVLVLRDETERPEGVAAGSALLIGPHAERIAEAASHLLDDDEAYEQMACIRSPYGDGHASDRICDAIESWLATNGSASS